MDGNDAAYKIGAFLRKTVNSASNVVDTIASSAFDGDEYQDNGIDVMDMHPEQDSNWTLEESYPSTPNADDKSTDATNDSDGEYGSPDKDRFVIISFPDNSQVRWIVVKDQRSRDAMIVATERFRINAEKFMAKKRPNDPTLKVVSTTIIDGKTNAIVSTYTESGFRHGDVLTVLDLIEGDKVDKDTAAHIPKVPYNSYESGWPWDPKDKSKYKYLAKSLRFL
jgi:hypothetical protein